MSNRFYNTHAQDYFSQTIEVDPSSFLSPPLKYLPPVSEFRMCPRSLGLSCLKLNPIKLKHTNRLIYFDFLVKFHNC